MLSFIAILFFALTRSEIIERLKAHPITKVEGLVQVYADCPADMRKEYHLPIAEFISNICRKHYSHSGVKTKRFELPGIIVHIGDVRTNNSAVVSKRTERDDKSRYTRIYIPAPGFANLEKLRNETVKAFYYAVSGEELDSAGAESKVKMADPYLRAMHVHDELERWRRGEAGDDDEKFLKMSRTVLVPGVSLPKDIVAFSNRLYLYPATYAAPFDGERRSVSFHEAIALSETDATIRQSALTKSSEIMVFGGGRSRELSAAATAYSVFLMELASGKKSVSELEALLAGADVLLDVAMKAAQNEEKGRIGNGNR
jgi:hypothetical protein